MTVSDEVIAARNELKATLKHQDLKYGQSYMIKCEGRKNRTKAVFQRLTISDIDEVTTVPVYEFKIGSYTVFLTEEMLYEIEPVDATKIKKKNPRTCDRCNGNKRFEHLKHIDNGICYKCEGTGVLD